MYSKLTIIASDPFLCKSRITSEQYRATSFKPLYVPPLHQKYSGLNSFKTGHYHIETTPLICSSNQWTVFYMITASVRKELNITFIITGSINVLDSCICYCRCITPWLKFFCTGIQIDFFLFFHFSDWNWKWNYKAYNSWIGRTR